MTHLCFSYFNILPGALLINLNRLIIACNYQMPAVKEKYTA